MLRPVFTSKKYSFPSNPAAQTTDPSQDTAQLYKEPLPASKVRSPPPKPRILASAV